MKKVLYKCKCGCKVLKSDLFLVRKLSVGRYSQRLRCAQHKDSEIGDIDSRLTTCDKCGCEVEFSGRGGTIPEYCKECLRPIRLAKMRGYAKNRARGTYKENKLRNGHLADPGRWDCATRGTCLNTYDGYDCIPCRHCQVYSQRGLDISNYLKSRGNSIRRGYQLQGV